MATPFPALPPDWPKVTPLGEFRGRGHFSPKGILHGIHHILSHHTRHPRVPGEAHGGLVTECVRILAPSPEGSNSLRSDLNFSGMIFEIDIVQYLMCPWSPHQGARRDEDKPFPGNWSPGNLRMMASRTIDRRRHTTLTHARPDTSNARPHAHARQPHPSCTVLMRDLSQPHHPYHHQSSGEARHTTMRLACFSERDRNACAGSRAQTERGSMS
jgi:hypothetical protein